MRLRFAAGLCLLLSCGRSLVFEEQPPPPVLVCSVRAMPEALDLTATRSRAVSVSNIGSGACSVSDLIVRGDPGFAVPSPPGTFTLAPNEKRDVTVTFTGEGAPFERNGELAFASNDPQRPVVEVPLTARLPRCQLSVTPALLTFTPRPPGGVSEQVALVANVGGAACTLEQPRLEGDSSFSFVTAPALTVPPNGRIEVRLRFTAPQAAPTKRTGTLRVTSTDGAMGTVALEATVNLCELTARPNPFDFGNVSLNTVSTAALTFSNSGTDTCVVSGFSLMADSLFSVPVMPGVLTIAPNGQAQVLIRFSAFDSAPPHLRTGTLSFNSNDPAQRMGSVPLRGFVSTICTEAGQFIYTVDGTGIFSKFDPAHLTSTTIGTLSCMNTTQPFSMNLDQTATAWIIFNDGKLFKVDVTTAACTATAFMPGQSGFFGFGMGSVFDAMTGKDTHYISGGPDDHTFGTLDLTALHINLIGQIDAPRAELSGTGDGQLWAFAPSFATTSGRPFLDRLDPVTGATLEHHELAAITSTGGYAIKFWGGAFYVFIGADVWKVPRNTLVPAMLNPTSPPTLVFTRPGLEVVGAGVSTCAPVMGP